jgi:UDP-N-acetylglucosamine acyltransferase
MELKRLYRIFFRSGLRVDQALAKIREELPPLEEVEAFCRFVENSTRGITR